MADGAGCSPRGATPSPNAPLRGLSCADAPTSGHHSKSSDTRHAKPDAQSPPANSSSAVSTARSTGDRQTVTVRRSGSTSRTTTTPHIPVVARRILRREDLHGQVRQEAPEPFGRAPAGRPIAKMGEAAARAIRQHNQAGHQHQRGGNPSMPADPPLKLKGAGNV